MQRPADKPEIGFITGEIGKVSNDVLRQLGARIGASRPQPEYVEYLGSAAVHIYKTKALDAIFFVSQTETLAGTNEALAGESLKVLRQEMMKHYGREKK